MNNHQPELGQPPQELLDQQKRRIGKYNSTAKAFAFALSHESEWVKAFQYDYDALESERNAYGAARSRMKLLRQYGEQFEKELELIAENDKTAKVYIVWLKVVGS
jgi:hypothetical protein